MILNTLLSLPEMPPPPVPAWQLSCRACDFTPKGKTPPRCPKCGASRWERTVAYGSTLKLAERR